MKKPALAVFAALLFPTLGLTQGTVSFGTSDPSTQYFVYTDQVTRAKAGTLGLLWWSPDNVVPFVPIATNSVVVNGWLTTAIIATTGPATPAGSPAWFYVSWSEGGYLARTFRFQNATGNPNGVPVPTPPATLDGWTSPAVLITTPEPSIFALAGLGVATWLIFRRRK